MNDTDYGYRVRKVVGTDLCRHKYRVVLATNTWKVKKLCLLQTATYLSEMTFKKCMHKHGNCANEKRDD